MILTQFTQKNIKQQQTARASHARQNKTKDKKKSKLAAQLMMMM
jgi:hypothetical protein